LNPYASPQAYRESAVLTASPEQLVVMLYDGAGRFLRQAEAALSEGAVEHAHDRLKRGEAIIDELLATLDMDQGSIAERLQAIYIYCKRCLMEARRERDVTKVRLVVRLMAELREAWAEVAAGGVPA
jgi:flagellar protein FliS